MRSPRAAALLFATGAALLFATGAAAAALVAAPAASGGATCPLPMFGPGRDYHPAIVATRFGPRVDNPWFPLPPDTTFIYAGTEDQHSLVDIVVPSHETRVIDGVRTRVVHDRLFTDGALSERTIDYYAQDVCGNVWYFGEDTAQLDEHGRVISTDGTWQAGVHGAQPGVFMPVHPKLGREFRQEWAAGVAEDQFVTVARDVRIRVPYGTFHSALRTYETTALEPGVLDTKVYVRGIGEVVERTVRGGSENLELVSVLR